MHKNSLRCVLAAAVVAGTSAALALTPLAPAAAADTGFPDDFHAWTTYADFFRGTGEHVRPALSGDGAVTLTPGQDAGSWTSPWYSPKGGFNELVASWQIDTPAGSWAEIGMQARTSTTDSQWYVMGDWAFDTSAITRHSTDGQKDAVGLISTDTFFTRSAPAGGNPTSYRLKVTLHGTKSARPVLRQVGAVAALPPAATPTVTSTPIQKRAVELKVPSYSQETHHGEYPSFDGGGEAWCSPTSTSMVLSYWKKGPSQQDIASLPADPVFDKNNRADGIVDWSAIHTYDSVYQGAGNWPFNTAYASAYGLDGSVRMFTSLRDAEKWLRRGVPVIVSLHWDNTSPDPRDHLDGSSISGTSGHLVTLVGLTASGDAIVNDPASPTNTEVRHVYKRSQFEYRWLDSTSGVGYLIKSPWIRG
ncbi:C39 family peptidase [Fodinicola acaciae]|uniref:C39 family peptidase n=1 Tax=Fodinicola acaciae TaxID=2681555 RepID=UPI0013D19E57|nr:C39 family peptidase [Fodinicola acaciae]